MKFVWINDVLMAGALHLLGARGADAEPHAASA